MSEINLYSFLVVILLQYAGAWSHFRKMKQTRRVRGNYWGYLFYDSPNKSAATGVMMIGSAWFSCTAGSGDLVNPELLWTFLQKGILHVPSINAILTAIIAGYAFDSFSNKGEVK